MASAFVILLLLFLATASGVTAAEPDLFAPFRAEIREAISEQDVAAAEKLLVRMPGVILADAVASGDTLLVEFLALADPDQIPQVYPLEHPNRHMRIAAENLDVPMLHTLMRCGFMVPDGYSGLEWGANRGHVEIVQAFFDGGEDLNVCDVNWNGTSLQQAIDNRRDVVVKLLLESGADVNVGNKYGWTPLHAAARRGYLDYAEWLVARGASINAKSDEGQAPIHEAIAHHHYEFARWLLTQGATLDAAAAAGLGDLEAVRRLCPDPLQPRPQLPYSPAPIFMAAKANQVEVVKHFISAGVDVNVADKWGVSLVVHAAAFGSTDVVAFLVEQKADLYLKPTDRVHDRYFSALHAAAHAGDLATIRLLLDRGMPVDYATPEGDTALVVAVEKEHLAAIRLLAERGATVDGLGPGKCPLVEALFARQTEVCRLLLELGANPNRPVRKDERYRKSIPLSLAVRKDMPDVFELLIKRGADPRGGPERDILIRSVHEGSAPLLQRLIDMGANVNATSNGGNRLPIFARNSVITDVNATSNRGFAPLDTALQSNNLAQVRVLLAAGAQLNTWKDLEIAGNAGRLGNIEILQSLQNLGLRLTDEKQPLGTKAGRAALSAAIKANRKDMVRYLVAQGVSPRAYTASYGNLPPIAEAAAAGAKTVLLDLIEMGADKLLEPLPGQAPGLDERMEPLTLALYAAGRSGRVETFCTLIRHGAWRKDPRVAEIWQKIIDEESYDRMEHFCHYMLMSESNRRTKGLELALRPDEVALTRLMLDFGIDVNQLTEKQEPYHFFIAKQNHVGARPRTKELNEHLRMLRKKVQLLLERGAKADWRDANNLTAAHRAVMNQHVEMTRLLVEHGAPLDVHLAAALGELDFLKAAYEENPAVFDTDPLLLKEFVAVPETEWSRFGREQIKADPPAQGVFCWAAAGGDVETIRWLASLQSASMKIDGTRELAAPLFVAIELRQRSAVKALLEAGANPNGHTELPISLIQAARLGDLETARLLLAHKADVGQSDKYDRTALHVAVERGDLPMAELLVKAGLPLDVTSHGTTPLELAFKPNNKKERAVGLYLLDAGADPRAGRGEVLYWEVYHGEPFRVEAFLKAGIDPNVQTARGQLPLQIAIDRYQAKEPHDPVAVEMMRLLLEFGADPEMPDASVQTAMGRAAKRELPELVELMQRYVKAK